MIFELPLKDGSKQPIVISTYAMDRLCKLTDTNLDTLQPMIFGSIDAKTSTISNSFLSDISLRAKIVAAGMDAYNAKEFKLLTETSVIDAHNILDAMDDQVFNEVWVSLYRHFVNYFFPNKLPKSDTKKKPKKATVKKKGKD